LLKRLIQVASFTIFSFNFKGVIALTVVRKAIVLGFIYVNAAFHNPMDYAEFVQGRRRLEGVRRVNVKALVNTSAIFPALPEDVVEKLGLPIYGEAEAETATEGEGEASISNHPN
jgi:hypothetical protein